MTIIAPKVIVMRHPLSKLKPQKLHIRLREQLLRLLLSPSSRPCSLTLSQLKGAAAPGDFWDQRLGASGWSTASGCRAKSWPGWGRTPAGRMPAAQALSQENSWSCVSGRISGLCLSRGRYRETSCGCTFAKQKKYFILGLNDHFCRLF